MPGARLAIATLAVLLAADGCVHAEAGQELVVTATAYNSVPEQTDSDPDIAAWGDRLEPGMRAIAVSRDLLELGLTRGVEVQIEGMPGTWVVRDKMARRWRRKIDVYMGLDIPAALEFGRQQLRIRWTGR